MWQRLLWCAAALLCLWILFQPHAATIIDETYYLGEAHALANGRWAPALSDPAPRFPGAPNAIVKYPIGWPLVLAPFVRFSIAAAFQLNLILHGLAAFIFLILLRRRGLPGFYALLFLAEPGLWFYAQTAMSDTAAVLLLLLSLWMWERDRPSAAGVGAGLAVLVRLHMFLFGAILAVVWFRKNRRAGLRFMAVWLMGVALTLAGYWAMQGSPWPADYLYGGGIGWTFAPQRVAFNLFFYAATLSLLYPALWRGWHWNAPLERVWIAAGVGVPCFYFFVDRGRTSAESLLLGQRLILPAIALLLLGYARELEGIRCRRAWFVSCFLAGALIFAGLLGVRYMRYQARFHAAAAAVDNALWPGTWLHYDPETIKLVVLLQKPAMFLPLEPDRAATVGKNNFYLAANQIFSYRLMEPPWAASIPGAVAARTDLATLYRIN